MRMIRTGIFISYRHASEKELASKLREELERELGVRSVFLDSKDILPGTDFRSRIENAIAHSRVMFLLIGEDWEKGLECPKDFVRIEIDTARRHDVHIVPLLLGTRSIPDYPKEVGELSDRHHIGIDPTLPKPDFAVILAEAKRHLSWHLQRVTALTNEVWLGRAIQRDSLDKITYRYDMVLAFVDSHSEHLSADLWYYPEPEAATKSAECAPPGVAPKEEPPTPKERVHLVMTGELETPHLFSLEYVARGKSFTFGVFYFFFDGRSEELECSFSGIGRLGKPINGLVCLKPYARAAPEQQKTFDELVEALRREENPIETQLEKKAGLDTRRHRPK